MRPLTVFRGIRTPVGITAAALLTVTFALAVFAPLIWGDAAGTLNPSDMNQPPSLAHPVGTDGLGRDILARVLVATRLSVLLALGVTAIGTVVGILLGVASVMLPRRAASVVGSVINIAVAFPGLLLALAFAMVFGIGTTGALFALGLAFAPEFARLTMTLGASVAGRDYIAAARVAGVGRMRMLFRHILPNISEPLVVNGTIAAGSALLAFAGLSYLGIGVQAPDYDWGRLLQDGLKSFYTAPAGAFGPGVAIVVAGLAFSLTGEAIAAAIGLRDRPFVFRRAPKTAREALGSARSGNLLSVQNLRVTIPTAGGEIMPVRGIDLTIAEGECVGVVGESGSGKSMTALAIAQLIEEPTRVEAESLRFAGADLTTLTDAKKRRLLGTSMSLVFQDPLTSFNPTMRIGRQLAEVSEQHEGASRSRALAKAIDRLDAVRIENPRHRAAQHPHELSGGMRQRAMIAMGLMAEPRLIIADEPTTALDVTVQQQVLDLLSEVRGRTHAAILFISHDLAVVSSFCERVVVMYAGRIVEELPTEGMRNRARHPYTRALLSVVPDLETDLESPLAAIAGAPPEPTEDISGCAFASRCAFATERCRTELPELQQFGANQRAACWHPVEIGAAPLKEVVA